MASTQPHSEPSRSRARSASHSLIAALVLATACPRPAPVETGPRLETLPPPIDAPLSAELAEVDRHIDLLEERATWTAARRWLLDHAAISRPRLIERLAYPAMVPDVLGRIGNPEDVALLKERMIAAGDGDAFVSLSGNLATGLAVHPSPLARDALVELLRSRVTGTVRDALMGLGRRGDPGVRADVERLLDHHHPDVRRIAAFTLADLDPAPSADLLRKRRAIEPDAEVRRAIDDTLANGRSTSWDELRKPLP